MPYTYNKDCAYANSFLSWARSYDVATRTSAANDNMSFWEEMGREEGGILLE